MATSAGFFRFQASAHGLSGTVPILQHGSTVLASVYTDQTLTVAAANPVPVGPAGFIVGWMTPGVYDIASTLYGGTASLVVPASFSTEAALDGLIAPTGALREFIPRAGTVLTDVAAALDGTHILMGLYGAAAGDVVTNLNFLSGATALVTPTHQFAGLATAAKVILAISADGTSVGTWAANTVKAFAMGTAYPVTTDAPLYWFLGVTASGNVPSLECVVQNLTAVNNLPPILVGQSSTAANALPTVGSTLGTITVGVNTPYGYTS